MPSASHPAPAPPRRTFVERFSRHVEKLPTRAFLAPLDIDEEVGPIWGAGLGAWLAPVLRGLTLILRACLALCGCWAGAWLRPFWARTCVRWLAGAAMHPTHTCTSLIPIALPLVSNPSSPPAQIDVELTKGNMVSIKLKAIGELQPSGMREVGARCGAQSRLALTLCANPTGTRCGVAMLVPVLPPLDAAAAAAGAAAAAVPSQRVLYSAGSFARHAGSGQP